MNTWSHELSGSTRAYSIPPSGVHRLRVLGLLLEAWQLAGLAFAPGVPWTSSAGLLELEGARYLRNLMYALLETGGDTSASMLLTSGASLLVAVAFLLRYCMVEPVAQAAQHPFFCTLVVSITSKLLQAFQCDWDPDYSSGTLQGSPVSMSCGAGFHFLYGGAVLLVVVVYGHLCIATQLDQERTESIVVHAGPFVVCNAQSKLLIGAVSVWLQDAPVAQMVVLVAVCAALLYWSVTQHPCNVEALNSLRSHSLGFALWSGSCALLLLLSDQATP